MATLYRPQPAAQAWENTLLELASGQACPSSPVPAPAPVQDQAVLDRAYARCEHLTRTHGRTFYLATTLLPPEKRRAIRALYAFCRVSDNIVDGSKEDAGEDVAARLAAWRRRATSPTPPVDDLVAVAWADARMRYQIPERYAEQLISGVERDLHQSRYATFADLATYCYGVAATVGLMSMHIIGFVGEEAIPYAIKLGVALQLTNILRDVGEDWRAGRVYLPLDELVNFGLRQVDLETLYVNTPLRGGIS